jgi:thymidylate synthase
MSASHTSNEVWLRNIRHVHTIGQTISPRGFPTKEILNHTSRVDMKFPCVTHPGRKMGFRFLAAEAHWILSGSNRVEDIRPYAKHIVNFSDNGYVFQGAYGVKVTEQLRYATETLHADPNTRQAVISVWRENPRPSKDIPCTLTLQFFIRKDVIGNTILHTVANMRSSDLWLGWVYDVFNFTMISAWVALRLREMSEGLMHVDLGTLYLNAGSQHLYQINEADAVDCTLNTYGTPWSYCPMDLTTLLSPGHLMNHLIALRDKDWATVGTKFFHELQHHERKE